MVHNLMTHRLPTRWDDTRIIVNDAVVIGAPYGLDNAKAAQGKDQSLTHIKRVMEKFYQTRKPAGSNRASVATPIAPRKGG